MTAITDDDLFVIVDDPTGTPVTKKATINTFAAIRRLSSTTGINAKTVATTSLYTVPTGYSAIITLIIVRVTAFTAGGKTVQVTGSVGANSPNFNDYYPTTVNTYTVTAVNRNLQTGVQSHMPTTDPVESPIYAAGSVFTLNITTASNATTETWSCDLFGYLIAT